MKRTARSLSLTQRLLALMAVALLPALVALTSFIISTHRERQREVNDLALRTGHLASLEIERIITGAEGVMQAVVNAPVLRSFDPQGCSRYLARVSAAVPQLSGFAVADAHGQLRCSSEDLPLQIDTQPYLDEAMRSAAFVVGTYTRSRQNPNVAFLPLALPITEDGAIAGAVVAGLDLNWLGARIRERDFAKGSALTIVGRDGIILAREPQSERFVGTPIPEEAQPLLRADRAGTLELTGRDGVHRVIGYHPPAANGDRLLVSAGISTDAAFAPIYASTYRSLGLAAAGTAATFALAWLVGNRLVRQPIRRLVGTIDAWRRGDVHARTGIPPSGNEISTLASAVDQYMDELVADRAARQQAEAHRALLLREMDHRIKNILATVQAVANQTFRDKASPDSLQSFGRRLAAMAETHRVLLAENWERADLRATLEAAVHPFGLEGGERLSMSGPPLQIDARAAVSLSMAVHELCTNAAKYGALSHAGGRVEIDWRVSRAEAGDRFVLTWTERDGPPVEPPARTGFGTRLIQSALASELGAEVDLRFPPSGVEFTLSADPQRILADTEASRAGAAA